MVPTFQAVTISLLKFVTESQAEPLGKRIGSNFFWEVGFEMPRKASGKPADSTARPGLEASLVRSSAAEYLTFVAAGGDSEASVEMRYEDENVWLTQKMMAEIYDVSIPAISQHLKRIFTDNELEESSVVKHYLITAAVQNKMHYAVHGQTAAEVIVDRADHQKQNLRNTASCRTGCSSRTSTG